ncbi:hypothetical protein ACFL59_00710 [Planctomycetota bacterium]
MDPIAAKGLGGLGNIGGELAKTGVGQKGAPGQFQKVMAKQIGGTGEKFDPQQVAENFMQTGKVESTRAPSMSERVAMRDGIAFQPIGGLEGGQAAWRPNSVQATGQSESVASVLGDLNSGQNRLDEIIGTLRSGKDMGQAELIGLQAEVHMLSEQIQLSTKLVDSAMQSLKQVMQQQA